MKTECTELFFQYREIMRLIWNLGFWPNNSLREWDSLELYREAGDRLFEAMVLLALGFQGRIEPNETQGDVAKFVVRPKFGEVELQVDKYQPKDAGHVWGFPVMRMSSDSDAYEVAFVRFFDWDELAHRDFKFIEVNIDRMDERPDLVGHHALVEMEFCSIWLIHQEGQNSSVGTVEPAR